MSTAADPDGLAGAAPHLSAAASTEVIVTFFQDWGGSDQNRGAALARCLG